MADADVEEISTHAPRTGSDQSATEPCASVSTFQPTLPARGATRRRTHRRPPCHNFNPRSPHGERRAAVSTGGKADAISTHAPRTGSDNADSGAPKISTHFNPRSPHGERHLVQRGNLRHVLISTHAPRTGSDNRRRHERRQRPKFQPTLPARGATMLVALMFGSRYFNPRSPHGERRWNPLTVTSPFTISTHAPRTGSDYERSCAVRKLRISTHAPRTGSDRASCR